MKSARIPTLLGALLALACHHAPTQPAATPDEVVGCYQLELGAWSGPHEAPPPPDAVMLMDSLGTFVLESGKHLIRPCPGDTEAMHYMAWWEHPAADSLSLVFTTGFVGIGAHLRRNGAQWTGTAVAFTDVSPFTEATAPLSLTARPSSPLAAQVSDERSTRP